MSATKRHGTLSHRELEWDTCDRCGRRRLVGQLVEQEGYKYCVNRCVDEDTALAFGNKRAEPVTGVAADFPVSIDH